MSYNLNKSTQNRQNNTNMQFMPTRTFASTGTRPRNGESHDAPNFVSKTPNNIGKIDSVMNLNNFYGSTVSSKHFKSYEDNMELKNSKLVNMASDPSVNRAEVSKVDYIQDKYQNHSNMSGQNLDKTILYDQCIKQTSYPSREMYLNHSNCHDQNMIHSKPQDLFSIHSNHKNQYPRQTSHHKDHYPRQTSPAKDHYPRQTSPAKNHYPRQTSPAKDHYQRQTSPPDQYQRHWNPWQMISNAVHRLVGSIYDYLPKSRSISPETNCTKENPEKDFFDKPCEMDKLNCRNNTDITEQMGVKENIANGCNVKIKDYVLETCQDSFTQLDCINIDRENPVNSEPSNYQVAVSECGSEKLQDVVKCEKPSSIASSDVSCLNTDLNVADHSLRVDQSCTESITTGDKCVNVENCVQIEEIVQNLRDYVTEKSPVLVYLCECYTEPSIAKRETDENVNSGVDEVDFVPSYYRSICEPSEMTPYRWNRSTSLNLESDRKSHTDSYDYDKRQSIQDEVAAKNEDVKPKTSRFLEKVRQRAAESEVKEKNPNEPRDSISSCLDKVARLKELLASKKCITSDSGSPSSYIPKCNISIDKPIETTCNLLETHDSENSYDSVETAPRPSDVCVISEINPKPIEIVPMFPDSTFPSLYNCAKVETVPKLSNSCVTSDSITVPKQPETNCDINKTKDDVSIISSPDVCCKERSDINGEEKTVEVNESTIEEIQYMFNKLSIRDEEVTPSDDIIKSLNKQIVVPKTQSLSAESNEHENIYKAVELNTSKVDDVISNVISTQKDITQVCTKNSIIVDAILDNQVIEPKISEDLKFTEEQNANITLDASKEVILEVNPVKESVSSCEDKMERIKAIFAKKKVLNSHRNNNLEGVMQPLEHTKIDEDNKRDEKEAKAEEVKGMDEIEPNMNRTVQEVNVMPKKNKKSKKEKNHRLTSNKFDENNVYRADSSDMKTVDLNHERLSPMKEHHGPHDKICSKKHKNEHCVKKHKRKDRQNHKQNIKDDLNYDPNVEASTPIYFSPDTLELHNVTKKTKNHARKLSRRLKNKRLSKKEAESQKKFSNSIEKCVNFISKLPAQLSPKIICRGGQKQKSSEESKVSSPRTEDCLDFDEVNGRFKRTSEGESDDSFIIVFSDAKNDKEETPEHTETKEKPKTVECIRKEVQRRTPRARIPSECDSEDSFVICFESDGITPEGDCYGNDEVYSDTESISSQSDVDTDSEESTTESSGYGGDFVDDGYTGQLIAVDENAEDNNMETDGYLVQEKRLKSCLKRRSSPKLISQLKADKQVQFDSAAPKVHKMIAWSFAYRQARIGHWERCGRDAERFRQRIRDTSVCLEWVFKREHRNRIFFQRFRPLLMRAIREEKEAKAFEVKRLKEEEEELGKVEEEKTLKEEELGNIEAEQIKIEDDKIIRVA